jgi:CHAD domain-containing protein
VNLEREAKLAADPSFNLPDLREAVPGVGASAAGTERFVTSYYDTAELRLTRWGGSLRYRTGAGWTVKLPGATNDEVITRQEVTFEGPPARPPAAALDLVSAFVRTSPVRLATRLQTLRHLVALSANDDGEVAEVVDDEVTVLDGRRIVERFREVEVELTQTGDDRVLEAVVSSLVRGGARRGEAIPKATRALRPDSLLPPDVVVPWVGKRSTVDEVVRAAIAASTERLIRHDPVVRIGQDPEGVHQARVATRRLRSDLRTFRAYLVDGPRDDLREELGWLGAELGRVRDLDVLDERLRRHASATLDDDARGVATLLQRLRSQRESARAELLSPMREARYLALLDDLVERSVSPPVRAEAAKVRAIETLADVMERPWGHLARLGERLGPSSPDTDLHEARIRVKRVRYAAEVLAPVAGKRARRFARRAEAMQGVLGEHQDAVMASAWLREQAAGTTSRVAFTAGELAAVEAHAKVAARARWSSAWDRLADRRLRFWE